MATSLPRWQPSIKCSMRSRCRAGPYVGVRCRGTPCTLLACMAAIAIRLTRGDCLLFRLDPAFPPLSTLQLLLPLPPDLSIVGYAGSD